MTTPEQRGRALAVEARRQGTRDLEAMVVDLDARRRLGTAKFHDLIDLDRARAQLERYELAEAVERGA